MRTHLQRAISRLIRGRSIWSFDWDICCILDGCRVDTFRAIYPDADAYWSVGSMSAEWIQRTFSGVDTAHVAYLSGNPFAADLDPQDFAYFHLESQQPTEEGIDTVDPRVLADRAVRTWHAREREDMRMIVHFMQPHVPFRDRPEWFDELEDGESFGTSRWELVGGEIAREEWMDAYQDALRWVLDDGVRPIVDACAGDIFLTSDHGNALGEWGTYGHPRRAAVPAVRKVPALTVSGNGETSDGCEAPDPDHTFALARAQLRALGYT